MKTWYAQLRCSAERRKVGASIESFKSSRIRLFRKERGRKKGGGEGRAGIGGAGVLTRWWLVGGASALLLDRQVVGAAVFSAAAARW